MINLKETIKKYPECLESAAKFKGFMSDLYPDLGDRARIKVLTDILDSGIVDEIRNGNTDPMALSKYYSSMEIKYGYSMRLIMEGIKQWINAFNVVNTVNAEKVYAKTDKIRQNPVDKMHIHKYTEINVPPTCQERGYVVHKCDCGYEYTDSFTEKMKHNYEIVDRVPATCFQEGRNDLLCSYCSDYKSEIIPRINHTFGKWMIEEKPSCEKDGLKKSTCKICGETKTAIIKACGHKWTEWEEQIHASCTDEGNSSRQCSNCGKIENKTLNALGHIWQDGGIEKEASCTEDGLKIAFCKRCGAQKEEIIKAQHKWTEWEIKTTDGKIYGSRKCSMCGLKEEPVPDSLDNFIISKDGTLQKSCRLRATVIIPSTVIKIEKKAFHDFGMISVIIPNSVKEIGDDAFRGCRYLTNIDVPNTVTYIGENAFYGCMSLLNISMPKKVILGSGAFLNCSSLTFITVPYGNYGLNDFLFYNCKNLSDIKLPEDLHSIGNYTFDGCKSLTNIIIPDGVHFIGKNAFNRCVNLTSIIIPESVKEIDNTAFHRCKKLVCKVKEGSYAEQYCKENYIKYELI